LKIEDGRGHPLGEPGGQLARKLRLNCRDGGRRPRDQGPHRLPGAVNTAALCQTTTYI
jgi:hypothetical protein